MKIIINDIKLNYEVSGVGPPLILLHGWGGNLHTFDNLTRQINEDFTVYQIDLPGFGESVLEDSYTIEDCADLINEFCNKLNIIEPVVLGHSFGGRVAIVYASKYEIKKLILVATPGIKEKFNLKKYIKIKLYKLSKKLHFNIRMGSTDYKNSNDILRKTLVMAVNNDLSLFVNKISCPTLLIYGKKDKTVPLYIGQKIHKMINGSGLVVVKKCGHFPYIEKFRFFFITIKSFLHSDTL